MLIFDEMITGMRWSAGGAQSVYGVTPDLSTWGKALGNGFPISALAGRRDILEYGGLNTDASRVFLLSTTHGPEVMSLAAYLAVVQAYPSTTSSGSWSGRGPSWPRPSTASRLSRGCRTTSPSGPAVLPDLHHP